MDIRLVRPSARYAEQVMRYRDAMLANRDTLDGCAGLEDVKSFEEWVDFESRLKKRYGENYVPSDVYLAVRAEDDRLVGVIDHRLVLSPFLLRYGGSVGCSVLPSERGKGYAGEMLRLLLNLCRRQGAERLLLTCDAENEASVKTIVKNGGVLENEIADDVGLSASGRIRRYWIVL